MSAIWVGAEVMYVWVGGWVWIAGLAAADKGHGYNFTMSDALMH